MQAPVVKKPFNKKTVSQYLPSLLGLWAVTPEMCVNVFVCLWRCMIKSLFAEKGGCE